MTVHPIGASALLLFAALSDLQERGLHPDSLTYEQTERLAREGLSVLGWNTNGVLELESYPGEDGLLLFIHTAPEVWRFPDGDALLDAMAALQGLDTHALYRWKDAFWLVGAEHAALSEFADPIRDDPFLAARLAEYALPRCTAPPPEDGFL